ncbi:unnamed protein product [Periconia digitata]|uniref:Enoyl reductase (ER) domain-containing protein n=1 Tax=Periconia digitata TaxID=1303443 RepID=A0A9W4U957_9PLEO|nr:unnamed protein product [Periconia digitata]
MSAQTPNLAAVLKAPGEKMTVEERKIPSPGPNQVVIRNHAIAMNPIDWKRQAWNVLIPTYPVVLGSDVSGEIAKVGANVTLLKPGDRVLGYAFSFLTQNDDEAAFQTYTVVESHRVTKIPDSISFNAAATLPQGVGAAALTLFDVLALPLPTGPRFSDASIAADSAASKNALLIWGASSSVGFQTVQMARKIGITVFAAAGEKHHGILKSLGVAGIVDYKSKTAAEEILKLAQDAGKQITYVLDAITTAETVETVREVLSKGQRTRKFAYLMFWPEGVEPIQGVWAEHVPGEDMGDRRDDLARWLFKEALPAWLEDGSIQMLPQQVVEGGLGGVQNALDILQKGVSLQKVVVEI